MVFLRRGDHEMGREGVTRASRARTEQRSLMKQPAHSRSSGSLVVPTKDPLEKRWALEGPALPSQVSRGREGPIHLWESQCSPFVPSKAKS